ncbi:MAG: topology modulation protein [Paenibacillaceae bacterium]|nr:topology modulation protein [Paenibacillaceae bacterium]
MQRIILIGSGGSGKSTLAQQLEKELSLPLYHLDAYYWKPGWTQTPNEEWDAFLEELVQKEAWILDGNYSRTLEIRMKRADTIILLDYSRWITVYRVIKRRIMYRGKTRPDLNKDCPESLDLQFLKWVWSFRKTRIPGIMKQLAKHPNKNLVILKSPKETKQFLQRIKNPR